MTLTLCLYNYCMNKIFLFPTPSLPIWPLVFSGLWSLVSGRQIAHSRTGFEAGAMGVVVRCECSIIHQSP
jgi:hypothetical protein